MATVGNSTSFRFRLEPPSSWPPDRSSEVCASPGFRFALKLLNDAVACGADKLELNFTTQDVKLRLRIDQNWRDFRPFERAYADALLVVLKQIARLNPLDRRTAQRGSFEARLDHKQLRCLISSEGVPTGELVTIEIPHATHSTGTAEAEGIKPRHSGERAAATHLVQCPHCSREVSQDDRLAGQTVGCPHCHGFFKMPHSQESPHASQLPEKPVPEISDEDLIPAQRKVLNDYVQLLERCQKLEEETINRYQNLEKETVERFQMLERQTIEVDYRERGRAIMESIWNCQRRAGEMSLGILKLLPGPPSAPPKMLDAEFNLFDAVEQFRLKRFPCVSSGPWATARTGADLLGLLESYRVYVQRCLSQLQALTVLLLFLCGIGFFGLIFLLAAINSVSRQDSTRVAVMVILLVASVILFFGLLASLIGYIGLVPYRSLIQTYQIAVSTFDQLEPLAKAEYKQALNKIALQRDEDLRKASAGRQDELTKITLMHQDEVKRLLEEERPIRERVERVAPSWNDVGVWQNWSPSNELPRFLRVGDFHPHPTKETTPRGENAYNHAIDRFSEGDNDSEAVVRLLQKALQLGLTERKEVNARLHLVRALASRYGKSEKSQAQRDYFTAEYVKHLELAAKLDSASGQGRVAEQLDLLPLYDDLCSFEADDIREAQGFEAAIAYLEERVKLFAHVPGDRLIHVMENLSELYVNGYCHPDRRKLKGREYGNRVLESEPIQGFERQYEEVKRFARQNLAGFEEFLRDQGASHQRHCISPKTIPPGML